jgi:hypothetical protein
MKIPGRSETTAGSLASNSFSISRAGPTAPVPAGVGAHTREHDRSASAGLFRGSGGPPRALDGPVVVIGPRCRLGVGKRCIGVPGDGCESQQQTR